jgi:hypothetical protein
MVAAGSRDTMQSPRQPRFLMLAIDLPHIGSHATLNMAGVAVLVGHLFPPLIYVGSDPGLFLVAGQEAPAGSRVEADELATDIRGVRLCAEVGSPPVEGVQPIPDLGADEWHNCEWNFMRVPLPRLCGAHRLKRFRVERLEPSWPTRG